MANEQNLIPNENRTPEERRENARKAGIASGQARRAKKRRGEVLKEILNTEITNDKLKRNLEALGIHKDRPTFEDLANANAMRHMITKGNMQDLQRMNDEAYGPQDKKTQLEVSGEASGITINVKNYSKGGDGSAD